MVVCKFFIQGNCRYGDRCWNEHPRGGQQQNWQGQGQGWRQNQNQQFGVRQQLNFGGGNRDHNYGQQSQNRFTPLANQGGGSQKGAPASVKDMSPQELVEMISQDMAIWDNSKMWPFSCYAVGKETACLPGFEDLSPEELRLEAYQTRAAGNFSVYEQKIVQLSNECKSKRGELKQPSAEVKQKLLQALMDQKLNQTLPSTSSGASGTSVFGGSTGNSVFGGASGSSSGTFGNVAPMGSSSGTFGNVAPNVNPFGGQTATSPSQGLFAATQPSPNQAQPLKPSLFGNPAPASSPGVFGGASTASPGTFGQGQQGLFPGGGSVAPSVGLFGKPASEVTSPGLFGKPATQEPTATGLFGKPVQTAAVTPGVFGNQTSSQGIFGNTSSNQVVTSGAPVANQTTFGNVSSGMAQQPTGTNASTNSQPGSSTNSSATPQPKSSLYTPMDQLTAVEKREFEAATFTLGKIPTRPPPLELCR